MLLPPRAEADRLALVELGDDAGQDAHQLERAAADDRQVVDLLGGEHAFARAGLGLNHFELRGDRDRLGLLADFEPDVDAAVVVRAERERLLLVGLEAGELDLQVVGAGEQARRTVLAAFVGDRRLHGLRACVGQRDCCARQDAAARVLHRAANRRGGRSLSKCRGARQQQCAQPSHRAPLPHDEEVLVHNLAWTVNSHHSGPSASPRKTNNRRQALVRRHYRQPAGGRVGLYRNRFRQQADGG